MCRAALQLLALPAPLHVAPCCSPRVELCCSAPHAPLQPARRALLPCASRPAAASTSRPTAASASRSAALRVAPCCSQRVAPYCSQRVAPCCLVRRALQQRARRALLQPARRALLPCALRLAAASARPVATTTAAAARATAATRGGAAGSADSAGGAGGVIGSAGGAAAARRATRSAGGATGARGAGPTTGGMHSRLLVSSLPRSLPFLPCLPSPPCLPCVEGRQRAAPHSTEFPTTTAPLQTLHMDVWGPAPVGGTDQERYFLLVFGNYTRYTTVFPLRHKADVSGLNLWPHVSEPETSPTLQWTSNVGDASVFQVWGVLSLVRDAKASKLSSRTLRYVFLGFPTDTPPLQFYHPSFRRVFSQDVTFDESVCYYRLHPQASHPGPSPSGVSQVDPPLLVEPLEISSDSSGPAEGGDPTADDTAATRRSPRLETPPVIPPQPSSPPPQPAIVDSGAETAGVELGGAKIESEGSGGAAPGGAATGGDASRGAATGGTDSGGPASPSGGGAVGDPAGGPRTGHPPHPGAGAASSRGTAGVGGTGITAGDAGGVGGAGCTRGAAGAGGAGATSPRGATSAGGARPTSPGGTARAGGAEGVAGAGGAGAGGNRGAGAASPGGVGTEGAGDVGAGGAAGDGGAGGAIGATGTGGARGTTSARGPGAAGASGAAGSGGAGGAAGAAGAGGAGAGGAGAGGAGGPGAAGTTLRRSLSSSTGLPLPLLCPPTNQSLPQLLPGSLLPAPAPHTKVTESLTERREPETRASTPVRAPRVAHPRPPAVPGTHVMALHPSSVPQRVVLPEPPTSSLPHIPDPESDLACAASPTVTRLLATVVTDPDLESRPDYVASLVTNSESICPPPVGGELALDSDVLEDREFELGGHAGALPRFVSMLLCPEGDPDALDIPTLRSYAEAIAVDRMWIFSVKRPQGSPPAFKARYVARGFSQRQGVDFFQTFSPTPKMTSLRVLLHVATQRDYELHSLDFSTAFLQGSLHEEIWLCRQPGFTRSFPAGTQWSLRRLVYSLRQAPREWHDTLRTTFAALGFAPSTADPSLFLRTDTSLPPFCVLVYVDDLVFANVDTEAQALVKAELQERHTCTDLGELRSYLGLQITQDRARRTITLTHSHMVHQVLQRFGFQFSSPQPTPLSTGHSLSAPPLDESVKLFGPYPELVGCLMYLMTCTRPELAYPLSLLARYVAPGRHRKVHWDTAKRVLRYLCSTSGMGLVLGGQGSVVLTRHSDASWADDQATQRSSQGYTFSLGSDSVSWRSTRSSSVLSSSCETEIYTGAMVT
ncbi:unnamed protein product [Closterium sp. NIES-54]